MMNAAEFAKMIETLKEFEGKLKNMNLSVIEKDLLLDKVRNLYEAIISGTTIPAQMKPEIAATEAEVKPEETVIPAEKVIPVVETIPEQPVEKEPEPVKEIVPEPVIVVNEEVKIEVAAQEPVVTPVKKEEKKEKSEQNNTGTLSDRFIVNHHSTVGEMMNNMRSQNDLTSQLRKKPVSNLKNAISINDRIMFARELFKGDNDLFHNTVDEINKLKQLDEAMELISDRIELNPQNPAVEKFMELLYRRFITTDDSLK